MSVETGDWIPADEGDFTSITISADLNLRRGAIIGFAGTGIGSYWGRITRAGDNTTFTYRPLHRWRWLESLRFAWERYVQWPLCDRIAALLPPEAP